MGLFPMVDSFAARIQEKDFLCRLPSAQLLWKRSKDPELSLGKRRTAADRYAIYDKKPKISESNGSDREKNLKKPKTSELSGSGKEKSLKKAQNK